jgi:hypothetical protein
VKKEANTNASDQDAGLRPIMDYRYLNKWTLRDQGPLPLLRDIHQCYILKYTRLSLWT